jgi:predicted flap endonuclease-1-like 5' DNA nuclease
MCATAVVDSVGPVGGWRWTYGVVPVLSLVYLAGVFALPESARYLLLNGRTDEGLASLRFVYASGAEAIFKEVQDVARASLPAATAPTPGSEAERAAAAAYARTATSEDDVGYQSRPRPGSAPETDRSALQVLFGGKVWPATLAGLGVITLQQVTGQPSVLYYATTIFEEAGVYAAGTIGVAVFKLLCTLVRA